jgi:hypothetical protein
MNLFIRSPFNNKGQFITDVGIVALAITFIIHLQLLFLAMAAS